MNCYTIITIAITIIGLLITGYVLIDEVRTAKVEQAKKQIESRQNLKGVAILHYVMERKRL